MSADKVADLVRRLDVDRHDSNCWSLWPSGKRTKCDCSLPLRKDAAALLLAQQRERDEWKEAARHMCETVKLLQERSEAQQAEIERLNKWADGFSDAQLKERATGEAYQRELRERAESAEQALAAQELDIEPMREEIRFLQQALAEAQQELYVLRRDLAEAQRDAERYRWFCDQDFADIAACYVLPGYIKTYGSLSLKQQLDVAIDAAIQQGERNGRTT